MLTTAAVNGGCVGAVTDGAVRDVAKIDAAMAGCLSWQAREDAIAAGALEVEEAGVMFI